jgi:uncharacterized protein involved in copper resistance
VQLHACQTASGFQQKNVAASTLLTFCDREGQLIGDHAEHTETPRVRHETPGVHDKIPGVHHENVGVEMDQEQEKFQEPTQERIREAHVPLLGADSCATFKGGFIPVERSMI